MLEINGLTHAFGDRTVLDDVSFAVERGELVGFVGPNGAGKTTTMRAVLGILEPDAGTVTWRGEPITHAVRRRFGYMPEERGLYPKMAVGEQLAFLGELKGLSAHAARQASERWVERLGLAERVDEPVEKLSLGNQQRVQLGAALVHEPEALVLDEPFSGLDPPAVDELSAVLAEEAERGAAIVFSSHQLDLVERLCEKVVIVVGGRLVAAGAVDELRDRHGVRRIRVELDDAPASWADQVPGVTVLEHGDGAWVLELGEDVDEQAVLYAAQVAGRLRAYTPVRPRLEELFRGVVAEGG